MDRVPTTRLQVTLPTKLMDNIDEVCALSGMTRSSWVEYTLAMAVATYRQLVDKTSSGIVEVVSDKE